jgi:hypothetical protein
MITAAAASWMKQPAGWDRSQNNTHLMYFLISNVEMAFLGKFRASCRLVELMYSLNAENPLQGPSTLCPVPVLVSFQPMQSM